MILPLRVLRLYIWAASFFSLFSTVALRAQTLTDFGDFGGGFSQARGINNLGQVVGDATTGSLDEAFLYSNGGLTNLGTLGAYTFPDDGLDGGVTVNSSQAFAINDSGEIVGQSSTTDGQGGAFLYNAGKMTSIVPGGSARGINNAGQIVGFGTSSAFLDTNQTITTFGGTYSSAFGINASGQVAGAQDINGNGYAFLYSNGTLNNLGTLPGGTFSVAYDVNNSGEVVGESSTPQSPYASVAFVYANGQMKSLGTFLTGLPPSEYNTSGASAINNLGQVVGSATAISTPQEQVDHAFLYSDANGLQDLDTLYATLLVSGTGSTPGFTNLDQANDINDLGQIVGYGDYWTGTRSEVQAFLITPTAVPEPASWVLGFVALGSAIVLSATTRLSIPKA